MIILDTHIWIWWVSEHPRRPQKYREYIQVHVNEGLGVSIISCWEVAKLVEYQRLSLALPIEEWLNNALVYPDIQLLDLTPRIIVESTKLPGSFHRDPADQLIVATARVFKSPLVSLDIKIQDYLHVNTQP